MRKISVQIFFGYFALNKNHKNFFTFKNILIICRSEAWACPLGTQRDSIEDTYRFTFTFEIMCSTEMIIYLYSRRLFKRPSRSIE